MELSEGLVVRRDLEGGSLEPNLNPDENENLNQLFLSHRLRKLGYDMLFQREAEGSLPKGKYSPKKKGCM